MAVVLPRWARPAGYVLVAVLVVTAWLQLAGQARLDGWGIGGGLAAAGLCVAADRLAPAAVAAVPAVLVSPAVVALTGADPGNVGFFVLALVAALLGLRLGFRAGLAGWLVAMATIVILAIVRPDLGWPNWAGGVSIAFWGAWAARWGMTMTARLHQAESAAAAADALAQRQRLAAELHDIVGHTLAVTLLHLGGARLAVAHDPAGAAAGIAEAERSARRSMTELRRLVRVLADDRDPDGDDPDGGAGGTGIAGPTPTAADLPALLGEYREAGLAVTEEVSGPLSAAGPAAGLVLYGVVREALANATRHAPGRPVQVRVDVAPDGAVAATVTNPCPAPAAGTADGMGLAAMRERVDALGGRLHAGPDAGRWVLRVELPC